MDYRARYIRLGAMVVIVFLLLALPWTYFRYELKKSKGKGTASAYVDNPVAAIAPETARLDIETFLKKTYPQNPSEQARFLPRQIHAFEYLGRQRINQEDARRLSDLLKTDYPDFYHIQVKFQTGRRAPKK